MGPIREQHLVCLRAVDAKKATVGAQGFAIDGEALTGDLHVAMGGLWLDGLVYGPPEAVGQELLWLTEAGEQALEAFTKTKEYR